MVRKLFGIVLILLLLLGAALTLYLTVFGGKQDVEAWVGHQVKLIASSYLNPTLDFDSLRYEYPRSVVIDNFRLTDTDPSHPGRGIEILTVNRVTLELGEIPRHGEPIVLERFVLDNPVVRLVPTGHQELVGYSNLLADPGEPGSKPADAGDRAPIVASDVFKIRLISVTDGTLKLDARYIDQPDMLLDDLSFELTIDPTTKGVYNIDTMINRSPVLFGTVRGKLDLDNLMLDVSELDLELGLAPSQYGALPPSLQAELERFAVNGSLKVTAGGNINFNHWRRSEIDADARLDHASLTHGEYRYTLTNLEAQVTMADQRLNLARLNFDTLGGQVKSEGVVELNDSYDMHSASLTATGLYLEQFYTGYDPDNPGESPLHGKLDFILRDGGGPLTDIMRQASGLGSLAVSEAKFHKVKVLDAIKGMIGMGGNGNNQKSGSDSVNVDYEMVGDHFELVNIDIRSSWYALAGDGTLDFNGDCDMVLAGGPLKKLESKIGFLGEVIKPLTGSVTKYLVTGPIDSPSVKVAVLGVKVTQ